MRTEVYCVKKTFVLLFAQERYRLVLLFGRLPDCDGNGCCGGFSPRFPHSEKGEPPPAPVRDDSRAEPCDQTMGFAFRH